MLRQVQNQLRSIWNTVILITISLVNLNITQSIHVYTLGTEIKCRNISYNFIYENSTIF